MCASQHSIFLITIKFLVAVYATVEKNTLAYFFTFALKQNDPSFSFSYKDEGILDKVTGLISLLILHCF
jgi:hypothetical protein